MSAARQSTIWQRASILLGLLALCVIVLVVDGIAGGQLSAYGVQPRSGTGLRGIVFAPFLHGNWAHLAANSVPFVVLGGLVLWQDVRRFMVVSFWAALGAGLTAWLLGSANSVHIGASGLVFGYLGFLVSHGWYAKRLGTVLLSVAVAVVWGGLIFGVLPGQPGVSWQSHAGGFAGGVLAARQAAQPRSRRAAGRRGR